MSEAIEDHEKSLEELEREEQLEKSKRKANKKNNKSTNNGSGKLKTSEKDEMLKLETEDALKVKERLPSSEEVYNRIKFDIPPEGIPLEQHLKDFTICYTDRFSSHLMSISYPEFEYGVVPLHRIQLYKFRDTVIWDRQNRLYQFPSDFVNDNNNNNNNN